MKILNIKLKLDKGKRLFQVLDMLTCIDKYDYKYKNRISFTKFILNILKI